MSCIEFGLCVHFVPEATSASPKNRTDLFRPDGASNSGAYLSPNLFLGELPESIVAFVISLARKASSSKVNKMAARLAILEKSAKGDSDHGVSQKSFDLFCSRTVEPLTKRIKALESKM